MEKKMKQLPDMLKRMKSMSVNARMPMTKGSLPYDSSHEVMPNRSPKGNLKNQTTMMNKSALIGIPSFKKGGKVKKTGLAKVHKGERVLNKKQAMKFDRKKVGRAATKAFKPY